MIAVLLMSDKLFLYDFVDSSLFELNLGEDGWWLLASEGGRTGPLLLQKQGRVLWLLPGLLRQALPQGSPMRAAWFPEHHPTPQVPQQDVPHPPPWVQKCLRPRSGRGAAPEGPGHCWGLPQLGTRGHWH